MNQGGILILMKEEVRSRVLPLMVVVRETKGKVRTALNCIVCCKGHKSSNDVEANFKVIRTSGGRICTGLKLQRHKTTMLLFWRAS